MKNTVVWEDWPIKKREKKNLKANFPGLKRAGYGD